MTSIRIKVKRRRAEALEEIYKCVISTFVAENEHELLLLEHVRELYYLLFKLLMRNQESYVITLTSSSALALMHFWQLKPMVLNEYAATVVNQTIALIDQKSKYAR